LAAIEASILGISTLTNLSTSELS